MVDRWRRFLRVAQQQAPADLLLRDARLVNVASGEIERVNVAMSDGMLQASATTRTPLRRST